MIEEALEELSEAAGKAHEALKRQLGRLRTGRAHPSLLDSLRVESYGSPTPIQQLASVTVPEPRMLMVKPWDKTSIRAIEKAIMESDLGLNPQNDGDIIRIPLPALTEERRRDLVKVAKKQGEECRVSIRKARNDCKEMLSSLQSESEISEDDEERAKKRMEDITQKATAQVEDIISKKEQDILAV